MIAVLMMRPIVHPWSGSIRSGLIVLTALVAVFCGPPAAIAQARLEKDVVPDAETAVAVAAPLLSAYLGRKQFLSVTKDAPLVAKLDGNVWTVENRPKAPPPTKTTPAQGAVYVTAGGGVAIQIDKRSAEVKAIFLSR